MTGITPLGVNAQQKHAIEHGSGPLLIVAGAGTGKTTVITQRIAWLILQKSVPIDGLLALTFTEKAATEMEERVDRLLPYGYVNLWISTFHAFCERILREHAIEIGLPGDFRLLNQSEQWLMIRRNLERFDLKYYLPLGNPTRFIGALLKHFSRLEDEDISPTEYIEYAQSLSLNKDEERPTKKKQRAIPTMTPPEVESDQAISEAERVLEVARAYATYRQLLLDDSSLDFGTLITWTIKLFRDRPAILKKYREQFQYILVDEFQDTNWAQYELIKMLSAPRNNVTVVGDDDQSIYKFRGASISNILQFRSDFPAADQVILTTNYRSRQNILDLAYSFIQKNNPNRLEVALNIPRQSKKKVSPVAVSKKLTAADTQDGKVEFIHCRTQEEEVKTVVERIITLQKKSALEWKEFAILIRANDQAEAYIHGLESSGVPYQFVASKGLYRDNDILDLTSYLRLLDNYHEGPALYRLLNMPFFKIETGDIVELAAHSRRKGLSLYQSLVQSRSVPDISPAGRKGIDQVLQLIQQGTSYSRNHKVTETLYKFLKDAGVLKELGRKGTERSLQRVNHIRKFLEEVAAFEKLHPQTSVRDFLEVFQLKLESGDSGSLSGTTEPDADGVRIMTVHGAKGLEFCHVFIVQLVDKRFPTIERKDPIEIPEALIRETVPVGDIHLEEERRLLYVAMTRAKHGLYFTAAEDYGGVRAKKPSRFLYELEFIQAPSEKETTPLAALERSDPQFQPSPDVKFLGSRFSFSALRSYEKCPWQFRYAYVLRVPVGGSAQLSYGESLHATLQKFFELVLERRASVQAGLFGGEKKPLSSSSPVSKEELLELYDQLFIDDWYDNASQRETFKQRGRAALTAFYDKHQASLPVIFGVEQPFNWKLDQYTISGKIDRLDQVGLDPATGRPIVRIVDYKSGKTRKRIETEDKYQLFIYALAAQDPNILNVQVDGLQYYFMEDNAAVDIQPTAKDLEKTESWIRSSIERIRSGNFTATPGPEVCRYCDYKDICEFRDPNA